MYGILHYSSQQPQPPSSRNDSSSSSQSRKLLSSSLSINACMAPEKKCANIVREHTICTEQSYIHIHTIHTHVHMHIYTISKSQRVRTMCERISTIQRPTICVHVASTTATTAAAYSSSLPHGDWQQQHTLTDDTNHILCVYYACVCCAYIYIYMYMLYMDDCL